MIGDIEFDTDFMHLIVFDLSNLPLNMICNNPKHNNNIIMDNVIK